MNERRLGLFSLKEAVFKKIAPFVPVYREVWRKDDSPDTLPIKENWRGNKLVGTAYLADPIFEKRYLEDADIPSFAEGRCVVIGGGDYKTVVADRDGRSDTVIKIYRWNTYRGKNAKQYAQAAAEKIGIIHEIAKEIAPGFVLPSEMIIDGKDGVYRVYERQQRAVVVDINLFDPRTAERLDKESMDVAINGSKRLQQELLRRGISASSFSRDITDDLDLTEIHWDAVTGRLVSLDIVDKVDISPMLSSSERIR